MNGIRGLSLIHFNCRSIKSKFEELKEYLNSLHTRFDIICISESWLTCEDNLLDYTLDNYDVLNTNRNNKRGGGVVIYVSKSLKYTKVQNMCEEVNDSVYQLK